MTKLQIDQQNRKVSVLCRAFEEGSLRIDHKVQRKLVWKDAHKIKFIDTVLRGFPFPEVFIQTTEEIDENGNPVENIIDGYQRVSTLCHYKKEEGVFANTKKIARYSSLSKAEKAKFLNTSVSLRVVDSIDEEVIKEIFSRINSTEYSLTTTEKRNALYGESELWLFARQLFEHDFDASKHVLNYKIKKETRELFNKFFEDHDIFSDNDFARMYSSQFGLVLICTIINYLEQDDENLSYDYYFDRDLQCDDRLEKFNEDFKDYGEEILESLLDVIKTITKLKFNEESFWISKSGLFTLMIELSKYDLSSIAVDKLSTKLKKVDSAFKEKYIQGKHKELTQGEIDFYRSARTSINQSNARQVRGKFVDKIISTSFK